MRDMLGPQFPPVKTLRQPWPPPASPRHTAVHLSSTPRHAGGTGARDAQAAATRHRVDPAAAHQLTDLGPDHVDRCTHGRPSLVPQQQARRPVGRGPDDPTSTHSAPRSDRVCSAVARSAPMPPAGLTGRNDWSVTVSGPTATQPRQARRVTRAGRGRTRSRIWSTGSQSPMTRRPLPGAQPRLPLRRSLSLRSSDHR